MDWLNIAQTPKTCFTAGGSIGSALPATAKGFAAGLAYDKTAKLLYLGVTEQSATGALSHFVVAHDANPPFAVQSRKQLPTSCLSIQRALTGLAYDAASKTLSVTEGASAWNSPRSPPGGKSASAVRPRATSAAWRGSRAGVSK